MNTYWLLDSLSSWIGTNATDLPIYAEGVKIKLQQVEHSLAMIKQLEHMEAIPITGAVTGILSKLSVDEQVIFYCDCFWDFLRSAIDILGQLINGIYSLGENEGDIDIKRVVNKLKSNGTSCDIKPVLDNFINCDEFKQLESYRHCSTHRRPIFIETQKIVRFGTPGYSSTFPPLINRYLCINPQDTIPNMDNFSRPVYFYCDGLFTGIEKNISKILTLMCEGISLFHLLPRFQ